MNKTNPLRALAGHIKANFVEGYTLLLIVVGPPLIAYIYVDAELALAVFIITQIALGILTLRVRK